MVRRCVKLCTGHEYAAKIINTKKLSARGRHGPCAGAGLPQAQILAGRKGRLRPSGASSRERDPSPQTLTLVGGTRRSKGF